MKIITMRYKTDFKTLKKETKVFRFGASTKGGQRANKKETGIRLRHIPSGVEVVERGRSQARNLKLALERLQERLRALNRPKVPRIPTKPSISAKLRRLKGKKIRSEKKKLRRLKKAPIWE